MNKAQRRTLKAILFIDVLLILYPPFEWHAGWRSIDRGHHLLSYLVLDWGVSLSVGSLAAEIVIVSVIGFTVFLAVRNIPDSRSEGRFLGLRARFASWHHTSAPRRLIVPVLVGAAVAGVILLAWSLL